MSVAFYFDPSCPFCWITSRWLLMVQGERDLSIDWRPLSLAVKNNELDAASDSPHAPVHRAAHRTLRVMLAATRDDSAQLIDLYTAFGSAHHIMGDDFNDALIKRVLSDHHLPAELLAAANDSSIDAALVQSNDSATKVAGDNIGVPTIIFTAENGQENGFFGPVLQQLPDKAAALKLWDGLSTLAMDSNFYELKRTRPEGGPDVGSTAQC